MKKKTILLFSTEAGIAHVTRTLAVGTELKKRGHRVIFAITKSKHAMVKESGLEAVDAPEILSDQTVGTEAVHNWLDSSFLEKYVQADQDIIERIRPDSLCIDLRPTPVIGGARFGIPMVFLTGSGGLPGVCHIPVLGNPFLFKAIVRPVLGFLVEQAKSQTVRALSRAAKSIGLPMTPEELIKSVTYIVPEANWYLSSSNSDVTVKYVGPIFWKKFDDQNPPWLKTMKPNGKTIYVSFGGTGYDGKKLIAVCEALLLRGFRVIVSASNIVSIGKFPKHKNLFVAEYLSGFAASSVADLVLCHGGYGTMMQAVLRGKPLVVVPYNFDQVLHGYRFRELGLAHCVTNMNLTKAMRMGWDTLFHMGRLVPVEKIVAAVDFVFQNKTSFDAAIREFQMRLGNTNGALEAARVVENL